VGLQGGTPFAAGFGRALGWITFTQGAKPKIARVGPEGVVQIDVAALTASDDLFRKRFESMIIASSSREAAMRKLTFLFRRSPRPTRHEVAELDPWIPLLEKPAYRLCTKLNVLLGSMRGIVVPSLKTGGTPSEGLGDYWAMVQTIAHLTLLASDPGARPWLSEMATTFEWQRWTPSVTLLRERTCWLAACAARSAIAFGPSVFDKYIGVLMRSQHAMITFDALYGLSAIGLSAPDEIKPLIREISSLRDSVVGNDHATPKISAYLFANCLDTLRGPDVHVGDTPALIQILGWQRNKPHGFASDAALRADPTSSLASGRIIGFAMLPLVVNATKGAFYPVRVAHGVRRGIHATEIEEFVRRAWINGDKPRDVYH
jgi:hypothetical protein